MDNGRKVILQMSGKIATALRTIVPLLGEETVNYSLQSFQEEAWRGFRTEPWKKRKNPTKWGKPDETDRALLEKGGKLKRSEI